MKKLLQFALLLLALPLAAAVFDLGPTLFNRRAGIWKTTGKELAPLSGGILKYLDSNETGMRGASNNNHQLYFYGQKADEVNLSFREGQLKQLTLFIYNRGDSGVLSEKNFQAILREVNAKIAPLVEGITPEYQNARVGERAKILAKAWYGKDFDLVLRWSSSEYIALDLYPPGASPDSVRQGIQSGGAEKAPDHSPRLDEAGNKFLLVPMIDQGKKEYALAAAIARVMRYYGSSVDLHVIAQLLQSDTRFGTDPFYAARALSSARGKLKIRLDDLVHPKIFENESECNRMLADYNQFARKQKSRTIRLETFARGFDDNRVVDYIRLFESLDPGIYVLARQRDHDIRKFEKYVREYIDRGAPLLWLTVTLPRMPGNDEATLQAYSRIISGYNPKTGDIIYTDSRGVEHEKKIMPLREAWAITALLVRIEPR